MERTDDPGHALDDAKRLAALRRIEAAEEEARKMRAPAGPLLLSILADLRRAMNGELEGSTPQEVEALIDVMAKGWSS